MSAWTSNDIERLTVCYTKGLPIKEIAKILKRTPTALHKAISRFKLHPLRPPKDKICFSENGLPIPPVKEKKHLQYFKKLFRMCLNEEWVSFDKVLTYLLQRNIHVKKSNCLKSQNEEHYVINRRLLQNLKFFFMPIGFVLKKN